MAENRFVAPIAAMLGKYDGKHMVCILWIFFLQLRNRTNEKQVATCAGKPASEIL